MWSRGTRLGCKRRDGSQSLVSPRTQGILGSLGTEWYGSSRKYWNELVIQRQKWTLLPSVRSEEPSSQSSSTLQIFPSNPGSPTWQMTLRVISCEPWAPHYTRRSKGTSLVKPSQIWSLLVLPAQKTRGIYLTALIRLHLGLQLSTHHPSYPDISWTECSPKIRIL